VTPEPEPEPATVAIPSLRTVCMESVGRRADGTAVRIVIEFRPAAAGEEPIPPGHVVHSVRLRPVDGGG
jgi:hypothetical protein